LYSLLKILLILKIIMAFRKKLSNRVKKTRLYLLDGSRWVVGNSSALLDLICTSVRTGASSLSARNAAVDITHGIEDYACSDYKCLVLDTAATACDMTGAVAAFMPGDMAKKVFVVTTSVSCFCRTFRNKCKETNVLGCS
jgi:hypothetical protein